MIWIEELSNHVNTTCPESHFRCPSGPMICLPVYMRCNDVYDCVGHEDEAGCDDYACPGFYRCRGAVTCVHSSDVCDGIPQCPQHDDELLCELTTCPGNCTCYGLAFFCSSVTPLSKFSAIRFLHGDGSGMTMADVSNNSMLVHLSLRRCHLAQLSSISLPNLRFLDLTDNVLRVVLAKHFYHLQNLKHLILAGNPLQPSFVKDTNLSSALVALREMDLSRVHIEDLEFALKLPMLEILNLSKCGIQRVLGDGFKRLESLRVLDARKCPMAVIPATIFEGLSALEELYADNYKLCCPSILPSDFDVSNCHAPHDEVSSCEALLRSGLYRVFLALLAALTLCGNAGSFLYRVLMDKTAQKHAFGVLVAHLCVSDFLMGVYLAMIGVADRLYLGSYLWKDFSWKQSSVCSMAGFLSLLSCEVSAFLICIITIDRFLVLHFPFSRLHLGRLSAQVACVVVWTIGLLLSAVPLLPVTSHWQFYSQTGICIPLPITRTEFAGRHYSFSVMIILNFVLFLLIAVGQVSIYWSVRTNSMSSSQSTQKSKDLTIARRLINVALSDFLGWFPICVLGLLASGDVPVPGEVNVAVAILVLPLNSAINPFLYTLNMIMEKRRQYREQKLEKKFLAISENERRTDATTSDTHVDALAHSSTEALKLFQEWLRKGLVSREGLQSYMKEYKG